MEFEQEGCFQPMSPNAQYLKSSALSLSILAVLELEFPFDDTMAVTLFKDLLLPINPRFSSIIVTDEKGGRKWKKVDHVNVEEHVRVPTFPDDKTVDFYDECFTNYVSNIGMEQFPPDRPLWEIHIIKYPTKSAASSLIFKLHHSLGDGYSLMGALLSCLQRVDDPTMSLTFPSRGPNFRSRLGCARRISNFFSSIAYTAYDFGRTVVKSSLIADDASPIRSQEDGIEFRPILTCTAAFSIDQIKQIKNKLKNVTCNDVITGVILLGTRLYMQKVSQESCKAKSTSLVLLNTRDIGGYRSVAEMIKPGSKTPWGNRYAFLPISIPKLKKGALHDPLVFVENTRQMITRQKNSASVYLTGQLLDSMRKIRGHEATARYIHGTLRKTSMAISNIIGPVEQMALANQPIEGLYFFVAGSPQCLSVAMVSYIGTLRMSINVEKGFMDPYKLKSCVEYAFEAIFKAALHTPPKA